MKSSLKRSIALATLLFFAASAALMPHVAHAGISSIITDAALWLPGLLFGKLIMPMMSLLVYLAGMMLNWSVQYSVIDMKANYASVHIDDVWTVMRDLANMGFIFVLLYTSIMTIFGQGKWKDTIVKIVVAALLINFSLFITKGIIDVSNILALLFYNAISPNATSASFGISSSFMDALGIQNLYAATSLIDGTKMAIIGVAGTIIYLVSAFTFLAVALMFIIRFMVLLFVVALSPLMFVGSIFPNAGGYAKQWWAALLNQSFFAPVYFMLTWVTLKVAQGLLHGGGDLSGAILGKEVGGVLTADPDAVGTIMRFVIIIGFLVMSLVLAKNMASKSAGGAVKYAMGLAGGAALGGAGKLGRGTFGRAGAAIAQSETLKNAIDKGGVAGAAGRLTLLAANKGAKSSFDLRASGLGKTLGGGTVKKGTSFEQDVKNRTKNATDRANYLKPSDAVVQEAKKKESDAEATLVTRLSAYGYTKSKNLTAAEKDVADAEKDTSKNADDRKKKAKERLKAAVKAEKPEWERLAQAHGEVAEALVAKEQATNEREFKEERPDRFVAKESEPTFNLPKIMPDKLSAKIPGLDAALNMDNIAVENINKKGIGGAMSAGLRDLASEEGEKADTAKADMQRNQRDKGMNLPQRILNTAATPKYWANKFSEKVLSAVAATSNLRQSERDARVEAIRKERKKKKDPSQEELLKALKDLKGAEGGGGGDKGGEKKPE